MKLAALFRRGPSSNEDREGAVMVVMGSSNKEGQAATLDEKVLRIVTVHLQCRVHIRVSPSDKKIESGLVTFKSV